VPVVVAALLGRASVDTHWAFGVLQSAKKGSHIDEQKGSEAMQRIPGLGGFPVYSLQLKKK
jgi:hypothetical protein